MIGVYLIKSTLCFAVLFGFYKIALEHKAMHQFKRFYLLAAIIFSFTLPLITFTYEVETVTNQQWVEDFAIGYAQEAQQSNLVPLEEEKDLPSTILWVIYGAGALIFGSRYMLNLVRLKRKIGRSEQLPEKEFTLSLLNHSVIPHSFLRWIFLNKTAYLKQEIAPEVLAHEATHVRQKHSWDILFIELIQVIFWFNPFIWLSKKAIKLNHEFLADQGAIVNNSNIAIYQNILLSYASSAHHTALESPFNYSLTKKRILMLSQTFSRKRAVLSAFVLLPILVTCVLLFNQEIKAQLAPSNTQTIIPKGVTATKWLKLWQDKAEYKLFLDGQPITNETILGYAPQELPHYETKYKDGQTHVSIWTEAYWQEQNEKGYSEFSNTDYKKTPQIHINGEQITINNKPSSIDHYVRDLNKITENWTLEEYRQTFPVNITVDNRNEDFIKQFDKKLQETNHWKATISYTPVAQKLDYTQSFIQGAQNNNIKPLVIEITNDQIRINGKESSIATFQREVDAITRGWEETDYTDPAGRSYLFKDNTNIFLTKLEKEYAKTHISKANGGSKLMPPPPPLPAPPSNPIKYLEKMHKLGGEFYQEEKKISFEEAVILIKNDTALNIQRLVPYDNPPKTYLTKHPLLGDYYDAKEKQANHKIGDTVLFSNGYDEKFFMVKETENLGRVISKRPQDPGVSKKELDTYNQLVKKHKTFPKGKESIPKKDLNTLNELYAQMNTTQKINNEPFPKLALAPKKTKYQKGDTITITEDATGKTHQVIIEQTNENTIISDVQKQLEKAEKQDIKFTTQDPVTAKEIALYDRLAKKHNANPNGEIIKLEVARMHNIYSRMTPSQKKKAETYPNIPPPPPKAKGSAPTPQMASSKGMFTPSKQYPNTTKATFEPGESLLQNHKPSKASDIYKDLKPMDTIFIENGKEISYEEGFRKLASQHYSMVAREKEELNGKTKTKITLAKYFSFDVAKDDNNSLHPKKVSKSNEQKRVSPHKKPNVTQTIATPTNTYLLDFTPGQTLKPASGNQTEVSDGNFVFNSTKHVFYENGEQLTFEAGISKWTSGNYFVTSKKSSKDGSKEKIELIKKEGSSRSYISGQKTSLEKPSQKNWTTKTEKMPVLEEGKNRSIQTIEEHVKNGGRLLYNQAILSQEDAILLVQEQYVAFMTNKNTPEDLILLPQPMTEDVDYYLGNKKLTEEEALKLRNDSNYKAMPQKTNNSNKPKYKFVKQ